MQQQAIQGPQACVVSVCACVVCLEQAKTQKSLCVCVCVCVWRKGWVVGEKKVKQSSTHTPLERVRNWERGKPSSLTQTDWERKRDMEQNLSNWISKGESVVSFCPGNCCTAKRRVSINFFSNWGFSASNPMVLFVVIVTGISGWGSVETNGKISREREREERARVRDINKRKEGGI